MREAIVGGGGGFVGTPTRVSTAFSKSTCFTPFLSASGATERLGGQ